MSSLPPLLEIYWLSRLEAYKRFGVPPQRRVKCPFFTLVLPFFLPSQPANERWTKWLSYLPTCKKPTYNVSQMGRWRWDVWRCLRAKLAPQTLYLFLEIPSLSLHREVWECHKRMVRDTTGFWSVARLWRGQILVSLEKMRNVVFESVTNVRLVCDSHVIHLWRIRHPYTIHL